MGRSGRIGSMALNSDTRFRTSTRTTGTTIPIQVLRLRTDARTAMAAMREDRQKDGHPARSGSLPGVPRWQHGPGQPDQRLRADANHTRQGAADRQNQREAERIGRNREHLARAHLAAAARAGEQQGPRAVAILLGDHVPGHHADHERQGPLPGEAEDYERDGESRLVHPATENRVRRGRSLDRLGDDERPAPERTPERPGELSTGPTAWPLRSSTRPPTRDRGRGQRLVDEPIRAGGRG